MTEYEINELSKKQLKIIDDKLGGDLTFCIKKRINNLQKENAELKDQIEQLSNDNHVLKTSFITQQEQIEEMKNWCNCKNYQQCLIELAEQGKGMKPSECCVNCKKWELAE